MYMRCLKNMESVTSEQFGKPAKGATTITVNSMQDRIANALISAATELMHKLDIYDRYREIVSGLRTKGEYIAPDFWMTLRYVYTGEIKSRGFWIYYRRGCNNVEEAQVIPAKEILISADNGDDPLEYPSSFSVDGGRNWYRTQYITNVLNGDPYHRATDEESFILNLDTEPNEEGFIIGSVRKKPVLFVPKYYEAENRPHKLTVTIDETTFRTIGTVSKLIDNDARCQSGVWRSTVEQILPAMIKYMVENGITIGELVEKFSLKGDARLDKTVCKEYK